MIPVYHLDPCVYLVCKLFFLSVSPLIIIMVRITIDYRTDTLPSDNVNIIVTTTQVLVNCLFASVISRDDPSLSS